MTKELKMPERMPYDGPMSVDRVGPDLDTIRISVNTAAGDEQSVSMSEYNAWRVLGALSFILGVPLSKKAQKAISF